MRFSDFPEFRPNVTPRQMFAGGAFGGTYWRPISSRTTGRRHRLAHKRIEAIADLPSELLASKRCDPSVNKFGVASGTSLEYWESKGWMRKQDPYGWVQWYCKFCAGRRTPDDRRQVDRWLALAGPSGRFRASLINKVRRARARATDPSISPRIRQTLWQWGYKLTAAHL